MKETNERLMGTTCLTQRRLALLAVFGKLNDQGLIRYLLHRTIG